MKLMDIWVTYVGMSSGTSIVLYARGLYGPWEKQRMAFVIKDMFFWVMPAFCLARAREIIFVPKKLINK